MFLNLKVKYHATIDIGNILFLDSKLEQNQVSGFLTLLRHMIHSQGTNQEAMIRTGGVATIGALLQKVRHFVLTWRGLP